MASAFVFMPFLIARFGLGDYGLFLLVGSLSGYLGLLDLGVGASLIKYVAEHRARDDHKSLSETVSTAVLFYAVIGLMASAIMVGIALFGVGLFNLPEESAKLARNLFLVGAVTSLAAWPLSASGHVLAGLQRYDLGARISIGVTLGNIVVTAAVIIAKQGPLILLVATSAVGITASVVNAYWAVRELDSARISIASANWSRLRIIFRFSGAVFVMQISSVLIYQQTDRVVLGLFVGTAAIGLYEAASKLHSLVRQFGGLSASAVVPTASQLDAEDKHELLLRLFFRGTKYTVIIVAPFVMAIIVLAEPLLNAWLGPEFVIMTFGAQLYVSYWLLNANVVVLGNVLLGINKLRFAMWYSLVLSLANVVLSVTLVNIIGINGVILGTVIPYYLGFPVYLRYASRLLGFRIADWWREVVITTYPYLLITVAIAVAARLLNLTSSLLAIALTAALSIGAYWLAVSIFGLSSEERTEASALLRSMKQRLSSR